MAGTIYAKWAAARAASKSIESTPFFGSIKEQTVTLDRALAEREKEIEHHTMASLALKAQWQKGVGAADAVCKELKRLSADLAKDKKNQTAKKTVDDFYGKFIKEDVWDLSAPGHPGNDEYIRNLKAAQAEWAKLQKTHPELKKSKVEALLKPLQDPLVKAGQALKEMQGTGVGAALGAATKAAGKLLKAVFAAEPSSEAESTYKNEQLRLVKEIYEELQKGAGAQDYKGIRK